MPEFTEFPIPRKDVEDLTSQQQEDVRVALGLPAATQAEAEAGTVSASRTFSPLRVRQASMRVAFLESARLQQFQLPYQANSTTNTGSASVTVGTTGVRLSSGVTANSNTCLRWGGTLPWGLYSDPRSGNTYKWPFDQLGGVGINLVRSGTSGETAGQFDFGVGWSNSELVGDPQGASASSNLAGFQIRNRRVFAFVIKSGTIEYIDTNFDMPDALVQRIVMEWDGTGNFTWLRLAASGWSVLATTSNGPTTGNNNTPNVAMRNTNLTEAANYVYDFALLRTVWGTV